MGIAEMHEDDLDALIDRVALVVADPPHDRTSAPNTQCDNYQQYLKIREGRTQLLVTMRT